MPNATSVMPGPVVLDWRKGQIGDAGHLAQFIRACIPNGGAR